MQPSSAALPPIGSVPPPAGQQDGVPIFKLDRDLLWHIFMINADTAVLRPGGYHCQTPMHATGTFSALITARWTSQVCRHWRDIVLNSSSLWGRCVDLEHLDQEHPHWRNEVLHRTGQSPLHVKGIIATPDEALFLLSLLDSNWERIRQLHVAIVDDSAVNDTRWSVLLRPAPIIESVVIAFENDVPDILSTQNSTIFADHAPALVWFASTNILFRMPSSSLPHLRHLELKGKFTVAQLLSGLLQMLRLEFLSINLDRYRDIEESPMSLLPHPNSPRLSHIILVGTIVECLTLLEHIAPAPGCSLVLKASRDAWDADMLRFGVPGTLFRYAKSFFDSHMVSTLALKLRRSWFVLRCEEMAVPVPPSDSESDSRLSPEFSVDIDYSIIPLPLDSLFYLFSTCRLHKVTTLTIQPLFTESEFGTANFTPFISSLHSLETLETTQALFDILFRTDESHPVLPSLKTLIYKFYIPFPSESMKNFLSRRQELGIPIQNLELSTPYYPYYQDMRLLDTVTGLMLKWKNGDVVEEYICGSGNPECLNLAMVLD